jgi:tRNA(fMet)-specific endonuclease VapC
VNTLTKTSSFLLDTNAVIAALGGRAVVTALLTSNPTWFLPVIAYGELTYGAYSSARVRQNLDRLNEFASVCNILLVDEDTVQEYGRIKTELRFAGKPIPDNDIWIAAIARQHDLQLLSDDHHFQHVERLQIKSW